jgi:hypothetical protein
MEHLPVIPDKDTDTIDDVRINLYHLSIRVASLTSLLAEGFIHHLYTSVYTTCINVRVIRSST